jgi:hypothetical protein
MIRATLPNDGLDGVALFSPSAALSGERSPSSLTSGVGTMKGGGLVGSVPHA